MFELVIESQDPHLRVSVSKATGLV